MRFVNSFQVEGVGWSVFPLYTLLTVLSRVLFLYLFLSYVIGLMISQPENIAIRIVQLEVLPTHTN